MNRLVTTEELYKIVSDIEDRPKEMLMEAKNEITMNRIEKKGTNTYELPSIDFISPSESQRFSKLINKIKESNDFLIPIGTYNNQLLCENINTLPNLLVCGTVMSGKTTFINSIITSVLLTRKPNEVRLILIDPKKVDFAIYEDLPYLLTPIIYDPRKTVIALKQAVAEMNMRYELFVEKGVRNIDGYNRYVDNHGDLDLDRLPYIMIIYDAISLESDEALDAIYQITTNGFKAGITIVLACNTPNSEIVSSMIKANFPARLCFRVASAKNSQVILDESGAESLTGYGKALFKDRNYEKAIRINTPYVRDEDIEAICKHIKKLKTPEYDSNYEPKSEIYLNISDDDTYKQIVDYALEAGVISISIIQRKFHMGFNNAANYMDKLESDGLIEPSTGSAKPRKVIKSRDDYE